jgi:uncharacterized protein YlaI
MKRTKYRTYTAKKRLKIKPIRLNMLAECRDRFHILFKNDKPHGRLRN